jgi:hypothetical protein
MERRAAKVQTAADAGRRPLREWGRLRTVPIPIINLID